jgi:hypothetical protein
MPREHVSAGRTDGGVMDEIVGEADAERQIAWRGHGRKNTRPIHPIATRGARS